MGSGDRIKLYRTDCFGMGAYVARFPFAITFNFHALLWGISVGFGKGYDE